MNILSASHIGCFKACPQRYNLRYEVGLKPVEDTESQRYGTNWHKIQEIVNLQPGDKCPDCKDKVDRRGCVLCGGNGIMDDGGMDAVTRYLNELYGAIPMGKTQEDWETERVILLYSLIGYNWYYEENRVSGDEKVIAQETKFRLPLKSPLSKRKLPNVWVDGRIDKIISIREKVFIKEHKSTSKSVEPDSDYWKHLTLDTQTLLYIWAARQLGYPDAGMLYDVWHRPGIRPSKLTQAESAEFCKTEEYCGQKFEFFGTVGGDPDPLQINGKLAEVEPGKKEGTFAIRETPEMFGARLLQDITERPTFYFHTKDIARTDADIEQFEVQLFNVYSTIRTLKKTNGWWMDESQCEAKFKCPYLELCYNHIPVDPENPPAGFTSRFEKKEGKQ